MEKYNTVDSFKFKIGDKIKLSDKSLENFNGSFRYFMSKRVYQIINIEVSIFQGIILKLNCGTTLKQNEAIKVDINTPLLS